MPLPLVFSLAATVAAAEPDPPRHAFADLIPAAAFALGKTADWVQIADGAVWVATSAPFALHRIDPIANTRTDNIPLPGEACAGMVPAFGAIWIPICATADGAVAAGLARMDLATRRVTKVYSLPVGVTEGGIAASDDSLWTPTDAKGRLLRINPADGSVRQTVQVCPGGENPLLAGGQIWVTCNAIHGIDRIDARTGVLAGHVETGPSPRFLATDGRSVWSLNQGDGSVTRIDVATARATATLPVRTPGHGGDIQTGGGRVWTTMILTPLTMIDPATNRILAQWTGPGGDSLNYGFGAVWLTDYRKGLLQRFNQVDLETAAK